MAKRFAPIICGFLLSSQLAGICHAASLAPNHDGAQLGEAVQSGEEVGFNDVPETHWARESIEVAAELEYIFGIGDGSNFAPDAEITRSEFEAMVNRVVLGTSVAEMDNYIETSVSSSVTRSEAAQIVCEILESKFGTLVDDVSIESVKQNISDWDAIDSENQNTVATCFALGIFGGIDDRGTFSGDSTLTRAQTAVVLCRLACLDV